MNKSFMKIILLPILLGVSSCGNASNENDSSPTSITNEGFEDDSLEGWTLIDGDEPIADGKATNDVGVPFLQEGDYYLDASDVDQFSMKSTSFVIKGSGQITFRIGGYAPILEVVLEKDDKVIGKYTNTEYINSPDCDLKDGYRGDVLLPYVADLSKYKNKKAYIRISKQFAGGAYFDDIITYNKNKIDLNKTITFEGYGIHQGGSIKYTKALNNVLNERIGGFLGSSVTYGIANGKSFVEKLSDRNPEMTYVKSAVNGTTLVDSGSDSYYQRLLRMDELDYDFFVVQLSTNDATKGYTTGQVEIAIRNIVDVISYYGCPILFYTNPYYNKPAYQLMVSLLDSLKDELGIHVLDMWNDNAINMMNAEERSKYMIDEIHPTELGYKELMACRFERAILEMIK